MNWKRQALAVAAFSALLLGGIAAPIAVQSASYADQVSVSPSQGVLDLKPCKDGHKKKPDCTTTAPSTTTAFRHSVHLGELG
jgi:hypothetical protein